MTTKEEHHVLVDCGRCAVTTLRPHSVPVLFQVDLGPSIGTKVKPIEVISIVSIIATEDIHAILIDDCRMAMPRSGWRATPEA